MLDVGTDNEALLNDKFYLGLRRRRVDEAQYLELVDEFMDAVRKRFGSRVMVQWENLEEARGMKVVERYRPSWCTFNDDQQGLAAAALAGIFAATTKVGHTHPLTHSLARSLTHSLTHSLTYARHHEGYLERRRELQAAREAHLHVLRRVGPQHAHSQHGTGGALVPRRARGEPH